MRRRRCRLGIRRAQRGRGIPYIYKNRVYLGKTPQTASSAVLRVLDHLLENVGNIFSV